MSDTNNDTSEIDKKKGNSLSDTVSVDTSKIIRFLTFVIIIVIGVLVYFSGSAIILFMCKLAQANILPTDAKCAPYTETNPSISPSPIKTNIFTTSIFSDPAMSMKLEIPYDINSDHKIIEIFRNIKNNTGFLGNYIVSIIESSMEDSNWFISIALNLMNQTLHESFIAGFGPILMAIIYAVGVALNIIFFIVSWFKNMKWFFKTNANKSGNGEPKWEDVTLSSNSFGWFAGVCLAMLFSCIYIIGFFMGGIVLSVFYVILIYNITLLSMAFYKGRMNGKTVTSFSIIPEMLKHYKSIITFTMSLFIVLTAFTILGTIPGIISIITVGLIWGGYTTMNLYKSVSETNLTPLVSYKQAKKTCSAKEMLGKKHSWLYNWIFGQSGGGLTRELKNINKKMYG